MNNLNENLPSHDQGENLFEILSKNLSERLEKKAADPKDKSLYQKLICAHIEMMHDLYMHKGVSRLKLYEMMSGTIDDLQKVDEKKFRSEKGLAADADLSANPEWLLRKKVLLSYNIKHSESSFNKLFVDACIEKGLDYKKKSRKKQRK